MSPISLIPAILGLLCGLLFFPVMSAVLSAGQRKKALKQERQRLKNTTFILSGTISDNQLTTHMRSLCRLQRQGVLHIETGRRRGYLLFRNGEIVDCYFRNKTGTDSLREILELTDGGYSFESRQVVQPNLIRKSVEQLLTTQGN